MPLLALRLDFTCRAGNRNRVISGCLPNLILTGAVTSADIRIAHMKAC